MYSNADLSLVNVSPVSAFSMRHAYFDTSNFYASNHATRIEFSNFNRMSTFQIGPVGTNANDFTLVNSSITGSTGLVFTVTYGKCVEISGTLVANNVLRAFRVVPADGLKSEASAFYLTANRFVGNTYTPYDVYTGLFYFQAMRNVAISQNTFSNTLDADHPYEFVIQLFDETIRGDYDLSANQWASNNSTVLVHSYFSGRFLGVKLSSAQPPKQADFFSALFQTRYLLLSRNIFF